MKTKRCVQKGDDVQRVHVEVADKMVNEEGYKFVPRHVWKKEVRDK